MEPSEYDIIDKILARLNVADFRAANWVAGLAGENFTEVDIAPIALKLQNEGLIEIRRLGNINQYKLTAPRGAKAQRIGVANYIKEENSLTDRLNEMQARIDDLEAKKNKD